MFQEYRNYTMKGSVVADEMFPEGAGPYMDIDEVNWTSVSAFCDVACSHRLYGLRSFPGQSLSRKDVSRTVTFPESHFPETSL